MNGPGKRGSAARPSGPPQAETAEAEPDTIESPVGRVVVCGLADSDRETYRAASLVPLDLPGGAVSRRSEAQAPARYLPQDILAVITAAEGGGGAAAPGRAGRLAEIPPDVPVLSHQPGLAQVLARVSDRLARSAKLNSQLMLGMAELRQAHEELLNTYNALRSFVSDSRIGLPAEGFVNHPDTDKPATPPEATKIEQVLPVELRSLCGVSLHLARSLPDYAQGELFVELLSPDDDDVRFSWRVPCDRLRPGWITFAFERNFGFLRRGVMLRLAWRSPARHAPQFSLGPLQLRPDKAAVVDGVRLQRSLALKAWISVPGAPLQLTSQMWPALTSGEQPVTRICLVIGEETEVVDVAGPNRTSAHTAVELLASRGRILVHPFGTQPTVARLVDACPPGTRRIVADVETDNELAEIVEYGLALPQGGDTSDSLATIEWQPVPPKVRGTVQLDLPAPLEHRGDLYLLTRMPQGLPPHYAWAQFTRIHFEGEF